MSDLIIRPAAADDEKFLWAMLFEASHSADLGRTDPDELREIPALARYVENWGVPGDFGVVGGADGDVQGAAWARLFTADNPAYGFVDEHTPELAIAVAPGLRGTGLGTALLQRLIELTREWHDALSLSVRLNNPARALYQRLGFEDLPGSDIVNAAGSTSVTMVLRFR
ncbi:GNAT family N-acetyltransferase [Nocardia yamanashiensis]|uniref:GNAT family N-acetyltransferase n=1 Tax=Nocardia yamanashiensis TaxID=209247 RepID=UPI001E4BD235|nr:GNAT family N-acetyltransferase [Nocardia yamanashiensis]UGT42014.1 GNAT family N-acetyltransferase [Nocardia yamanashiensis]